MYVKLPSWFKIETPIGSYNPDWDVVINEIDETNMYATNIIKGLNISFYMRFELKILIMILD